jgi:hypothetical protein
LSSAARRFVAHPTDDRLRFDSSHISHGTASAFSACEGGDLMENDIALLDLLPEREPVQTNGLGNVCKWFTCYQSISVF